MNNQLPGLEKIRGAARRIEPYVHRTPVFTSAVTLAVLLTRCHAVNGRKIGLILFGGNADLDNPPWIA
jgi:hypothetical protein